MSTGISTNKLVELIGTSRSTFDVWVHRGIIKRPTPGKWSLAEAFALGIFHTLSRDDRSLATVLAETNVYALELADLIKAMISDTPPRVDRVLLLSAGFESAEPMVRVVTNDGDLATLLGVIVRKRVTSIELRDITNLYCDTLAVFQEARRASQPARGRRSRVLA